MTRPWDTMRGTLLLHPYQFPMALVLAGLSIVFAIWPDALEHAPIAFEQRGVIHHVWHYTLLVSSFVTLYGMLSKSRRKIQFELAGLLGLSVVVALNTIALTFDAASTPPGVESGLALALRYAIFVGFLTRMYTMVWQPTIHVSLETSPRDHP